MEVTLFVKAGREADRLGAGLESQRVHLLALLKLPEIKVVLVDAKNPPPEYTKAGFSQLPAVLHSDGTGSDNDVISFLEEKYPGGIIKPDNQEKLELAEKATKDVYPTFCSYMMGSIDHNELMSSLEALNAFLSNRGCHFLFGDTMSLLDTQLLVQFHEIRVAVDRIKGWSIPEECHDLWMYLFHAYMLPAFANSCPPDLEICLDWVQKTGKSPSVIKMPEWLPAEHHGSYLSFNVPGIAVCPPCPSC